MLAASPMHRSTLGAPHRLVHSTLPSLHTVTARAHSMQSTTYHFCFLSRPQSHITLYRATYHPSFLITLACSFITPLSVYHPLLCSCSTSDLPPQLMPNSTHLSPLALLVAAGLHRHHTLLPMALPYPCPGFLESSSIRGAEAKL